MTGFMQRYGYPLCAVASAVLAFFLMVLGLSLVTDLGEVAVVGRLMDALSGLAWVFLKVACYLVVYVTYLYFLVPLIGGIRTVMDDGDRFGIVFDTMIMSLVAVLVHMGATDLLKFSLGHDASTKGDFFSVIGFSVLSYIAGILIAKSVRCANKAGWLE